MQIWQNSPAAILTSHSPSKVYHFLQSHLLNPPLFKAQCVAQNSPRAVSLHKLKVIGLPGESTAYFNDTNSTSISQKTSLHITFFLQRALLNCQFIAICQAGHLVASPRKATQHHQSLSGKIPHKALGGKICSKLDALLQLPISKLDSTNEITFQLGLCYWFLPA